MPVGVIQFSAALLAVVFAWSGGAKVARYDTWRALLARYRLGPIEVPARVLVPLMEVGISAGLILGVTRISAALALASLGGFSIAVVRLRSLEGDRLPCGCFGATTVRDYRVVLARSGLLALLCAVILLHGEDVAVFGGISRPQLEDALPVALTTLGVATVLWLVVAVARASKKGSD